MADTPRTQAYLTGTSFADGQAAGAIVPQNVRDLIVSMGTRCLINVIDYGADPTGGTDSTVAFQNAMAAGPCFLPSFVPGTITPAIYRVSNCIVPSGASLIGGETMAYYGGGGSYKGFGVAVAGGVIPAIIAPLTSATTRLFNVDGKSGILFRGLVMDCSDVSGYTFNGGASNICDIVSGGGTTLTFDTCSFFYGKNGIGGAVSGSVAPYPSGTWIANIHNCSFQGCVTGINDMTDCHVGACWFSCNNGINGQVAGISATTIANCRLEWCGLTVSGGWTTGGYGITSVSGGIGNVQINGCYFDTNGQAGINLVGSYMVGITGNYFQENGCNCTTTSTNASTLIAASAHVAINGGFNINFTGNTSRGNINTGSRAVAIYAPAAWVNFGAAPTGLVFVGNDLSGYNGSTAGGTNTNPGGANSTTLWHTGTAPAAAGTLTGGNGVSAFIMRDNLGTGTALQDIDTR